MHTRKFIEEGKKDEKNKTVCNRATTHIDLCVSPFFLL